MSDDARQILYLVLQLPLFVVGVAGLVLAFLRRRRRPRGALLYALGVGLLLGNNALMLGFWQFDGYQWVTDAGIDFELVSVATTVLNQLAAVAAAGLITAAVFVREENDGQ